MCIRKIYIITTATIALMLSTEGSSYAFWVWTPKSNTIVNPKFAVKDTPREQYDWAMRFYNNNEFERAAEEFIRLTKHYPDSTLAPEAQYYAGRAYEEDGKYYFAFQNYQKTVERYPYTKRLDEIVEREFNIAGILQNTEDPKLMDLELSLSLERSITVYDKVVENNPFGPLADKALYKLGECYRRGQKYKEAMEAYERIINDYPESRLVPDAKYQLAYTRYEASLAPEYDQESTEEALRDFKHISETTAVPAVAEEAEKVFDELREKKAQSELKIAEFYERQKQYRSALIYYRDVAGKFQETESAKYAEGKIESLQEKVKDR